jgi:hypothetical protein
MTRDEAEQVEGMLVELLCDMADCDDDDLVPLGWLVGEVSGVDLGELAEHETTAAQARAEVRRTLARLALIRAAPERAGG